MAGRIREEDIAEVREKARIDDVVSQYVTLRNAGGGSQKGLCPFHDEKSPSFNVNPGRGFFHCLAGETRVLTWDGPREIRELAGGTHRVLGARGDWLEAPFKSYGVQQLHRIVVTRNRQRKELFATDGHRWFVRSGRDRKKRREVLTADLKSGDRLASTFPRSRIQRTTPSPFGIAHGFTYGDGTRSGTGSMALLCPPKDLAMLKWFPNSHTSASGDNLLVHHLPRFFKDLPPLDESVSYLYGWLAGYFAADGCVAEDGTVILNSARREDLEFVRTVCTRLGIATYGITSQSRVGLGTEATDLFRVHFVNDDLTEDFFLLDSHRQRFVDAERKFARLGWVVQSVEPTDRVEEVFCAEVEDGHAFVLEDNILTGNCFGCGEGGDVITFLMKIDGLSFGEAVERLAEKVGVVVRREDDGFGGRDDRPKGPQRGRLIEAHKVAQLYYAEQLGTPDALAARQFLAERSFDQAAAETFGIGFAPREGEALFKHLRGRGFTQEETVEAGLVAVGRSAYDRFRGRLLWPIRDASGDTIGFGARRIFDDDRIEAKYLNTPETKIYKKSQVLYGLDLARREIGRSSQAVIVEGYTDVMACHLAGVGTAVATCGTAFGDDHARVLRRFLNDHEEFRGEVIFTFDGDAAGQKAAVRAFGGDQNFVSQTYVSVEPDGLDPCDLRIKKGDAAVRELVARRVPLYRFVLSNIVAKYDLDRADGRIDALREGARLVSSIRDRSKVDAFARELAGMVGVDPDEARAEVRRSASRQARDAGGPGAGQPATAPPRSNVPDLRDPRFSIERETLKLVIQHPMTIGRLTSHVGPDDFTHPTYRAVWEIVAAAGGPTAGAGDAGWATRLRDAAVDPAVSSAISALGVEPLMKEPDAAYVAQYLLRLQELTVARRIADIKSKLQRTNPVENPEVFNRMFGELAALEAHRRALRDRLTGPAE
ncbi:DNA primase [Nocardioides sp. LMS-CY]|uniref:DNA primase n=1 Tax=Nocardioides sp. (strain LMS-CY) TaxID=2840457 RepID=UPI001C00674B|nr:DNA primase [Nocardioides sp. LMS-CY]QWF20662.1 DNA primase [Nocardioides sp. LMS-CY]